MARYKFERFVLDNTGAPVGGTSVSVYLYETNTGAKVYLAKDAAEYVDTVPQLISGTDGRVMFWVDSVDYSPEQRFRVEFVKDDFQLVLDDVKIVEEDEKINDIINGNIIVGNADKVDGFHASLTSTANTIPVAGSNGKLDIGWLPYSVPRGFENPIDLTNATSDYFLQKGEVAVINFSSATSVPLRIATQSGTLYFGILDCSNTGGTSGGTTAPVYILPNNTTYTNAFVYAEMFRNSGTFGSSYVNYNAFRIGWGFNFSVFYIQNYTQIKSLITHFNVWGSSDSYPTMIVVTSNWRDTTTPWTSLGTVSFPQSTNGRIFIRRLA